MRFYWSRLSNGICCSEITLLLSLFITQPWKYSTVLPPVPVLVIRVIYPQLCWLCPEWILLLGCIDLICVQLWPLHLLVLMITARGWLQGRLRRRRGTPTFCLFTWSRIWCWGGIATIHLPILSTISAIPSSRSWHSFISSWPVVYWQVAQQQSSRKHHDSFNYSERKAENKMIPLPQ